MVATEFTPNVAHRYFGLSSVFFLIKLNIKHLQTSFRERIRRDEGCKNHMPVST